MAKKARSTTESDQLNDSPPSGSLVDFLRNSPFAEAIAFGELPPNAFEQERELPRDIDLFDAEPTHSTSVRPDLMSANAHI